jgi:KDO2-lipid IV(A) lauroyltransferase
MVSFVLDIIGFVLALCGARARLWFARILAFLVFDLFRIRRKMVMQNLQRVFGAQSSGHDLARLGRISLTNFILTSLEFFGARKIFPRQTIEIECPERMSEALGRGRGAYAMVIHSGNFEMMAFGFSRQFVPIHAPVKSVGKGKMAAWVRRNRAINGMQEIVNEGGSLRSRTARILDGLKKNQVVGFMVDQRRSKGVLIPFFGELAWTNAGLFYLWKQFPAPIIPVTIRRTGLDRHIITIHEEFLVQENENWKFDEFVLENCKIMNQRVEALVLQNPQEYFWMHDRWKK